MPNRILKESICSSDEIDALDPAEEVFFYRLMVVVDDFGLMDARPQILKAKCYPLKSIDIKTISKYLNKLANVGLVSIYQVKGRPFLRFSTWERHQQIRAKKAKYPTPDQADTSSDINCNQVLAIAPVIQSNPNPIRAVASMFVPRDILLSLGVNEQVADDWLLLRKKKRADVTKTALDGILAEIKKSGLSADDAFRLCCKRGWQGFDAAWVTKDFSSQQAFDPCRGAL